MWVSGGEKAEKSLLFQKNSIFRTLQIGEVMSYQQMTLDTTIGIVWIVLFTAHWIGDFWIQTERQSQAKGKTGEESWSGRFAAARHVATYSLTQAIIVLTFGVLVLHLQVHPDRMVLALSLNAFTHWWIDRRWTLQLLARLTYSLGFYKMSPPFGGAYLLDQAWHYFWLLPIAVLASS
jgi:hypothetical protein